MHTHYHEIEANTYYEAGLQQGSLFTQEIHDEIDFLKKSSDWKRIQAQAEQMLPVTVRSFPHLFDELKGYAQGAQVPLAELWPCIVEEAQNVSSERCTTIVTNKGYLVGHNEDWDEQSTEDICLIKKRIGSLTRLELFYYGSLGGNAISISSFGVVQAINTLHHATTQPGIPRNVIARWLAESESPQRDVENLNQFIRASGYAHIFTSSNGNYSMAECTETEQISFTPQLPFVHANHYISTLASHEAIEPMSTSFTRYDQAQKLVSKTMSVQEMQEVLSNGSQRKSEDLFNTDTIARTVFDLELYQCHVWLAREKKKGWVTYDLDFLKT